MDGGSKKKAKLWYLGMSNFLRLVMDGLTGEPIGDTKLKKHYGIYWDIQRTERHKRNSF